MDSNTTFVLAAGIFAVTGSSVLITFILSIGRTWVTKTRVSTRTVNEPERSESSASASAHRECHVSMSASSMKEAAEAMASVKAAADGNGSYRRLTHSQIAAVEDSLSFLITALECTGAILSVTRQGPHAYPTDVPTGTIWKAVVEALEKDGVLPQREETMKKVYTKEAV
jgi:hypothetical protein